MAEDGAGVRRFSEPKPPLRGEGGEFEGRRGSARCHQRRVRPGSRGVLTCSEGLCATRLGVTVLVVLDAMPDSVRVFRGWPPGSRPLGGWLLLAARVLLAPVGAGGGQGT